MTSRRRAVVGLALVAAASLATVALVTALTSRREEAAAVDAGLGPQGRVPQFKVECGWSHSAPDDPIVHPGTPGRSHLHDFFGNTATDADILTIPGVGNRMLREFKEYRPYRAMAQFDREIAKYVDAKELSRLRRYVEIR